MSSLSNVQRLSGYYAEQATSEEIITAYLDALCDSLIGIIPLRERIRLREEAGRGKLRRWVCLRHFLRLDWSLAG